MTYEFILTDRAGQVVTVTLNRPQKRNALTRAMLAELEAATQLAARDDSVSVIVIRGAGPSFCAGNDMLQGDSVNELGAAEASVQAINQRWITLRSIPKPVIAQVHGYCLGLGTFLALCCDLVIAAEDARIGVPSVPVDWNADWWVWRVGAARAKQMVFSVGAQLTGLEAVRWGFANFAVPAADLDAETARIADWIARTPLPMLRLKKHAIDQTLDAQGFRASAAYTAGLNILIARSHDAEQVSRAIRDDGLRTVIERYRERD